MERRDVTPFPVARVQRVLAGANIDGWLLYDFHGSNPVAVGIADLHGRHTTRRWFYFIPAVGTPTKIVHTIEAGTLDALPGRRLTYSNRFELEDQLIEMLRGSKEIAMEYSPECSIPYLARVDAGTVEFMRRIGLRVISSGDLVSEFEAAWDETQIATHREASAKLYRIKDRAFAYASQAVAAGRPVGELEIQTQMMAWFDEEGLTTDAPPIVAVGSHAGDPHYAPTPETSRVLGRDMVLLLDLWGKLDQPGSVYADITWVGYSGEPPSSVTRAFGAVVAGRDAAVRFIQARIVADEVVRGWEADRAARDVITAAGYGKAFVHRTGHSLGVEVHGNGANLDDYETRDDRRLLEGSGFTIEPGVYLRDFGVRSEINLVVGRRSVEVTGPCQHVLVRIG
jgi:Xaa-Pro aminopeptidase